MTEHFEQILSGIQNLAKESEYTRNLLTTTANRLDNSIADLREASLGTARELGGIQMALKSVSEASQVLAGRVSIVEQRQADCPARHEIKGTNARVKKLEVFKEKLQEERGETTGVVANPREFTSQQPGMAAAVVTATTKDIIMKAGPWIIAAALTGAAVGGYLLRMLLPQ
jgi:predicted phage tail protein